MCGRFTLTKDASGLQEDFPAFELLRQLAGRYNIGPAQPITAFLNDGLHKMDILQWGLIPPWAKDPAMGSRMINARAETLAEKPAFKTPYKRKRCLIPADGYYEWKRAQGKRTRQPLYFRRKDQRAFAFAGLWEEWHDREGGLLMTASIITTEPNDLVRPVHHRMPAIIAPEHYDTWLSRSVDKPAVLDPLLRPWSPEAFEAFPVNPRVNRLCNDKPSCIEREDPPLRMKTMDLFGSL